MDAVLADSLTDEKQIEHILDGILDFGDDLRFLELSKKLCRHIFGHTPTSEYQHNNPLEIWQSTSGGKIGIDCGCGFPHPLSQGRHPAYGRLACLRLDDMQVFYSEEEIPEEVEEILW